MNGGTAKNVTFLSSKKQQKGTQAIFRIRFDQPPCSKALSAKHKYDYNVLQTMLREIDYGRRPLNEGCNQLLAAPNFFLFRRHCSLLQPSYRFTNYPLAALFPEIDYETRAHTLYLPIRPLLHATYYVLQYMLLHAFPTILFLLYAICYSVSPYIVSLTTTCYFYKVQATPWHLFYNMLPTICFNRCYMYYMLLQSATYFMAPLLLHASCPHPLV